MAPVRVDLARRACLVVDVSMHALIAELAAIEACIAPSAPISAPLARLHHNVGWNDKLHLSLQLFSFFIDDTDGCQELLIVFIERFTVKSMEASREAESPFRAFYGLKVGFTRETVTKAVTCCAAGWAGLARVAFVEVRACDANTVLVVGEGLSIILGVVHVAILSIDG